MSVYNIYQDIVTDLLSMNGRGLPIEEGNILGLTEQPITRIADVHTHLQYSLQVRKNLAKPDKNIKIKSHMVVVFKLYQAGVFLSQLGFVELAGSENASTDKVVFRINSLTQDEKKNIARSFNALSAMLTSNQPVWNECVLASCLKNLIDIHDPINPCSVTVICNVLPNNNFYKHTVASLKFASRIKDNFAKESAEILKDLADTRRAPMTDRLPSDRIAMTERALFTERVGQDREERELLKDKVLDLQRRLEHILQLGDQKERENEMLRIKLREQDDLIKSYQDKEIQDKRRQIELEELLHATERKLSKLQEESSIPTNYRGREEQLTSSIKNLENLLLQERELHREEKAGLKKELERQERLLEEAYNTSMQSDRYDKEVSELRKRLREKMAEWDEIQDQRAKDKRALMDMQTKLDVEKRAGKQVEQDRNSYRDKVEELTNRNGMLEGRVSLLLQKLGDVENELAQTKQEAHLRQAKHKEMKNRLRQVEFDQRNNIMKEGQKEIEAHEEMRKLLEENKMIRDEFDNLARTLEDSSKLLEEQESELRVLRKGHDENEKTQDAVKNLNRDIKNLEKELMHAHETIRKLEEARVMSEQREAEMTDDIENLKKAQGEELEELESQVQSIEEELIRLREQNKWLQGREQDLIKELRQAENSRDKYKTKTTHQKQRAEALEKEIKKLQSRIDGLVEQHKWEVENLKSGDDKNKVLTSRLQALQDIQGLIKAHRVRTVN